MTSVAIASAATEEARLLRPLDFSRLSVERDDRTPDLAWSQVSGLAAPDGPTVHDAGYVEFATRLDLPLAASIAP